MYGWLKYIMLLLPLFGIRASLGCELSVSDMNTLSVVEEVSSEHHSDIKANLLMELYDLIGKSFSLTAPVDVPDEPKWFIDRLSGEHARILSQASAVKTMLYHCCLENMRWLSGNYLHGFYLYRFSKLII